MAKVDVAKKEDSRAQIPNLKGILCLFLLNNIKKLGLMPILTISNFFTFDIL